MIHSNRNSRATDICQTPCLKLTGRRCWRYPENTRISRGWQSGSCVLGVGASSSSHPPLRPACDHDISRQDYRSLRLRGRKRTGRSGGDRWPPRERRRPRLAAPPPSTRHPVSHRTCPPRPPRVSRVTHTARDESPAPGPIRPQPKRIVERISHQSPVRGGA